MIRKPILKERVIALRRRGLTYGEIIAQLGQPVPKSTMSGWCRDIILSDKQLQRITEAQLETLKFLRSKALAKNIELFNDKVARYRHKHLALADFMQSHEAKLLALAVLYLGEGAKWSGHRGPMLGSSDPQIIKLYISLMRDCYGIELSQLRCRIQHRADQNADQLLKFWSNATGVRPKNFYPSYVDKRTIGQKTRKLSYKGVCSVTCAGTHIQLELEQIAGIIFEAV
jgi:hypothetical protein